MVALNNNAFVAIATGSVSGGGGGSSPWTAAGSAVDLVTPSDYVLIQSSLSVQGSGFSVGASTFIVANGLLGINIDTSLCPDPYDCLDPNGLGTPLIIFGNPNVNGLGNVELLGVTADGNVEQGGLVFDAGSNGQTSGALDIAEFDAYTLGSAANNRGGELELFTKPDGGPIDTAGAPALLIDNQERVGIGTTSLDPNGRDALLTLGAGSGNAADLTMVGNVSDAPGKLQAALAFNSAGNPGPLAGVFIGEEGSSSGNLGGSVSVLTKPDGGNFNVMGTPALFIDQDGDVGIGTASPTNPLQMGSGAYVTSGGVWTNASSRAFKEDIADLPLGKAVEALRGLDPVTFRYKREPDETHVGFIAEDVPNLVATKDRRGLSAMDIVAVLTKVLQDQQAQVKEQQSEIEALQAELKELRKQ